MAVEEKANKYAEETILALYSDSELMQDFVQKQKKYAKVDFIAGYNEAKKETSTWVSVRYTSPEYFESLFGINMPDEQRYACHYDGDDFVSNETGETIKITHWMYAPEAPEDVKAFAQSDFEARVKECLTTE